MLVSNFTINLLVKEYLMKYLVFLIILTVGIPSASVANSFQVAENNNSKNYTLTDSNKKNHLGLNVSLESEPKMPYRQLFFKLLHHKCPLH